MGAVLRVLDLSIYWRTICRLDFPSVLSATVKEEEDSLITKRKITSIPGLHFQLFYACLASLFLVQRFYRSCGI
nr:hypothetical protein [Tanacetum cinerariifolium]